MRTSRIRTLVTAAVATAMLAGCADGPTASRATMGEVALVAAQAEESFIVLGAGNALPATLEADVAALGGVVESTAPSVGMATVRLSRADARTALKALRGVSDVAADPVVQWQDPNPRFESMDVADQGIAAAGYGDAETFRALQWAPDAISAPAAWNAGYRGAGARVAILDGGIHSAHIDIAPNLDVARSRSFDGATAFNTDLGTFWHGTHVAGIVAAPGQNVGTVGIAPNATIIGVKVLHGGSGQFSWLLNGIVYAATPISAGGAGAHIINMSLGAGFERQGRDAAALTNAISRTTMFARQQGVTVIAAAGNSAFDLDRTNNLVFFPAQAAGVISVSATGPLGWALGSTDLDRPASYTNFGQSAISFAGPGGDFALPGTALCTKPRNPAGSITVPCWVFDMVMAPCRGGPTSVSSYCWAAGTSMASPAVAGVAALIVGKYGAMQPAQLEARIRASSDDLGKRGNDDYYGGGRVNAWRAVQ